MASASEYVPVEVEWVGAAAATGVVKVSSKNRAPGSTANLDIQVPPLRWAGDDPSSV
jgi:hypothetical protein